MADLSNSRSTIDAFCVDSSKCVLLTALFFYPVYWEVRRQRHPQV